MVGNVPTVRKSRFRPGNLTKNMSNQQELAPFPPWKWNAERTISGALLRKSAQCIVGSFWDHEGIDIAGPNGKITNFRYLIVKVGFGAKKQLEQSLKSPSD